MTNEDITKAAALYMLKRGLASYTEIAELSGRSRQIIRVWAQEYPNARAEYLKAQWAKAMARAR
jgi:transposase